MKTVLSIIAALAIFCLGTLFGCASSSDGKAASQQGYAQQPQAQQGYAQQGYAQQGGAPMGGQMGGQMGRPGGPGPGQGGLSMLFNVSDANHDGQVTYEEFMAFQNRDFSRRDANGDRILTKEEFTTIKRPGNPGMPVGGAQPVPMQ
jgi:hypothetical protein